MSSKTMTMPERTQKTLDRLIGFSIAYNTIKRIPKQARLNLGDRRYLNQALVALQ